MKFTKMQGCGNDYVYVNCFEEKVEDPNGLAIKVSERHFGIGSDGLVLIQPSDIADFTMSMYNADGSQGKMCGNAIRCVGKYVYENGLTDKTELVIETLAGLKYLTLTVEDGKVPFVTVDMGEPILVPKEIPVKFEGERMIDQPLTVNGKEYRMTSVSMGNPHTITFVDNTKEFPVCELGPYFENHEAFPERVNTEFVQVIDRKNVNMRVWERGSGETFACGTGACATTMACILNGKTENEITVHMLGGDLKIRYDEQNGHVYMTGPATVSFTGEIEV